ncbi:MAG: dTMP kinase [Aggregatilineales bacterium]
MFISFEGVDGSGKTSQIALLAEFLRAQGQKFVLGREPGGTIIGDHVRSLLHAPEHKTMDAHAEFLLYSASRAQLVAEIVRPALAQGKLVILDRYVDSTYAYQGYGRGLDLDVLHRVTAFATGGLLPNCTIYLDISVEQALERRRAAAARGAEWTRLDAETLAFHRRVHAGYEQLITAEPGRFVRIDAATDPDTVQTAIRKALAERTRALTA